MDKECILILVVTMLIWLWIQDVNANETVTILNPDGSIQICSVTPNGVIVCL
jgi:hypothetical protein